ncbi:MAG: hypothetical protein ABSF63_15985 [Candidatus Bathyarchaeia archaeon]
MIQQIDSESLERLLLAASYFRADCETTFFVEYLSQHASKEPKEVGQLYLQVLRSGIYPQYEAGQIQQTVQAIYEHDKDTAR